MKNNETTVHIKQCYLEMFKDYPDVVDVETMREMLGGIHKSFAYRLIRSNKIKHLTCFLQLCVHRQYGSLSHPEG